MASTSSSWAHQRQQALARAGHRCERCGRAPTPKQPLHVHHRTYERVGQEQLDDLGVLCPACHRRIHARGDAPQSRLGLRRSYPRLNRFALLLIRRGLSLQGLLAALPELEVRTAYDLYRGRCRPRDVGIPLKRWCRVLGCRAEEL